MRIFLTAFVGLFVLGMSFDSDAGKRGRKKSWERAETMESQPIVEHTDIKVKLIDFPSELMHNPLFSVSYIGGKLNFTQVSAPYESLSLLQQHYENIPSIETMFFTYFINPPERLDVSILSGKKTNEDQVKKFEEDLKNSEKPLNLFCEKIERTDYIEEHIGIRFMIENDAPKCQWFSSFDR